MSGEWGQYVGPAAGVATSVLWTATSMMFTAGGRRIGATLVNVFRIWFAIVLLGVTHRLVAGTWLPDTVGGQVALLGLSGVVGLAIGDQSLFTAFIHIGPRLAMLIMATSPILAALFGWVVLGERLGPLSWLGIAMTIGGVAWVVLERPRTVGIFQSAHRVRGVVYAFIGAVCQAGGLLLSKAGMGHGWLPPDEHVSPLAAAFTRMAFAGVAILPILLIHRRRMRIVVPADESDAARSRRFKVGFAFAACGAVVGPFLGMWMSLVAADRAPLGIAQTLCSLSPVFILPFAVTIHKEAVSPRAASGAVLAVAGSAVLFLAPA